MCALAKLQAGMADKDNLSRQHNDHLQAAKAALSVFHAQSDCSNHHIMDSVPENDEQPHESYVMFVGIITPSTVNSNYRGPYDQSKVRMAKAMNRYDIRSSSTPPYCAIYRSSALRLQSIIPHAQSNHRDLPRFIRGQHLHTTAEACITRMNDRRRDGVPSQNRCKHPFITYHPRVGR